MEISVRLPADHDKLEAELQDRFGLQAVKVVDFSDDYEQLLKNLGRGGAALFEEICSDPLGRPRRPRRRYHPLRGGRGLGNEAKADRALPLRWWGVDRRSNTSTASSW